MSYGYTCLECGAHFDEPARYTERHGFHIPPYESFSGCPYCGGAYVETVTCASCGWQILGDYVKINETGACYCEDCFTLHTLGE